MSFITGQPSQIEVLMFEKSELFKISKSSFELLSASLGFGDKICRFASEGLFIHKQQKQIDILTKTAKECYAELHIKQPNKSTK